MFPIESLDNIPNSLMGWTVIYFHRALNNSGFTVFSIEGLKGKLYKTRAKTKTKNSA